MKSATNGNGRTPAVVTKTVKNSADLKAIMGTLVSDLRAHKVTPMVANAMCNASGKLLKIVEMEYKYGRSKSQAKRLTLTSK